MNLTDAFESLTLDQLQEWLRLGQEEHLHLDFKLIASPDLSHADDKKNLAKALAAFANSDGGIVVWGVNARKDADKVDRAQSIVPIPNVARFVSRLNELTATSVTPLVDGVRHCAVVTDGDAGCAISLIPSSDAGPHMAKASEDRYYKRSGDSFRRMEHFDVADMFGRRRRPVLSFATSIVGGSSISGGGPTRYNGQVIFGVRNTGRTLAKSIYLAVHLPPSGRVDIFGIDGNRNEGLPRIKHAGPVETVKYGGSASIVVHPEMTLDVGAIEVSASVDRHRLSLPRPITIRYEFAAEDVPLEKGAVTIESDQIARVLYPPALYPPASLP